MQAATLELSWKQREADLMRQAEDARQAVGRVTADQRLKQRRAGDDARVFDGALVPNVVAGQDH